MINYPASLKAVGGARTGIAPVNLLDVQDVNGNTYYWADRKIVAPPMLPSPTVQIIESAAVTNATASIAKNVSSSVGPFEAAAVWSNFALTSTLPDDAAITGIYPVIVASATTSDSVPDICHGSGLAAPNGNNHPLGGAGFANPVGLGSSFSSTELWGPSIGTNLALLASQEIGAGLFATNNSYWGPGFDTLTVTAVGFAIYYTSATAPGGSPPIAAPFAPPAGTYVAWAVPGTVAASGTQDFTPFLLQGSGSQSASGTAAVVAFTYGTVPAEPVAYSAWLLSAPAFTFNRSLQTDMGNFEIQNLSGDTLARDFEKVVRRSALEGAFFVYRLWQPDAQTAWLEVHGTLTVEDIGVDTATLKGVQAINPAQDDTPLEEFSETCQINWALARCGSTQPTECQYSFQSCQVIERFFGVLNSYEKNYGDTEANIPTQVINRTRKV